MAIAFYVLAVLLLAIALFFLRIWTEDAESQKERFTIIAVIPATWLVIIVIGGVLFMFIPIIALLWMAFSVIAALVIKWY
jgi:hypothetical protein